MIDIIKFNKASDADFFQCQNISQLVRRLEDYGTKKNWVICKIKINDRFLDSDEEDLLHNMSLKTVNEVEVHYSTPRHLVLATMKNIIQLIDSTVNLCVIVSEKNMESEDGNNQLGAIIKNCHLMIESLREVYNTGKHQRCIKHHALWKESESEVSQVLEIVVTLLEHKNYKNLAEVIKYDLTESLLMWQDTLELELASK